MLQTAPEGLLGEFKNKIIEHLETYDFISSAHSLDKLVSSSKLTEYQQLIKNGYHPDRSGDIVFILEPQTIIHGEKGLGKSFFAYYLVIQIFYNFKYLLIY